ncbi:MAG: sulfate ABC transporter ATP-binding protein [Capsulimonadaceae bacterium]|nr:sulfate ABC transporter ATP-binding protein [Capsulimonadaceae bacterium]
MSIEVSHISKSFGGFQALNDINLKVESGELVALLGPSGCGKTTLLRIIAGLEAADEGSVVVEGKDATNQAARERGVGFVFQHYALFRHLSVLENVAFGLRVRPRSLRPSNAEIKTKALELLRLVQLEGLEKRSPSELSGGQRQRVALARALAVEPNVLLLDEPFGALDAQVRIELRRWLRRLHDDLHMTSVFVTHDQEEALELADRVVVMNKGQIEQIGTPQEVYERPASPFVYHFLGSVNLFHGRVHNGRATIGSLDIAAPDDLINTESKAVGFVRPHELEISRSPNGKATLQARVSHIHAVGATIRVELVDASTREFISAELTRSRYQELALVVGDQVYVTPSNIRVFAADLDFSI